MGQVVHGASCPWGELSVGRVVRGASCPWGELSVGWIVRGVNCPWGELSVGRNVTGRNVRGAKCPWGEMSWGKMSWGEFWWGELSWGELSWGEWSGNPLKGSKKDKCLFRRCLRFEFCIKFPLSILHCLFLKSKKLLHPFAHIWAVHTVVAGVGGGGKVWALDHPIRQSKNYYQTKYFISNPFVFPSC